MNYYISVFLFNPYTTKKIYVTIFVKVALPLIQLLLLVFTKFRFRYVLFVSLDINLPIKLFFFN